MSERTKYTLLQISAVIAIWTVVALFIWTQEITIDQFFMRE